jgi:hypothetical protein
MDVWGYFNIVMTVLLLLFTLSPSGFLNVYDRIHNQLVKLWQKITKG